jgi:hypothetical protein
MLRQLRLRADLGDSDAIGWLLMLRELRDQAQLRQEAS